MSTHTGHLYNVGDSVEVRLPGKKNPAVVEWRKGKVTKLTTRYHQSGASMPGYEVHGVAPDSFFTIVSFAIRAA